MQDRADDDDGSRHDTLLRFGNNDTVLTTMLAMFRARKYDAIVDCAAAPDGSRDDADGPGLVAEKMRRLSAIADLIARGMPLATAFNPRDGEDVFLFFAEDERFGVQTLRDFKSHAKARRQENTAGTAAKGRIVLVYKEITPFSTSYIAQRAPHVSKASRSEGKYTISLEGFEKLGVTRDITQHVLVPPRFWIEQDAGARNLKRERKLNDPISRWFDLRPGDVLCSLNRFGNLEPFKVRRVIVAN